MQKNKKIHHRKMNKIAEQQEMMTQQGLPSEWETLLKGEVEGEKANTESTPAATVIVDEEAKVEVKV